MSESSSDDETEFVTIEETPIVRTIKNAKGRKAGLALAREKNTAQRRAVKNVMEAHKAVSKVKELSEKAGTAYTISKRKALEAGMPMPEVPTIENRLGDMLASMQGEIDRLKAIKEAPAPVKQKKIYKKREPAPEPEPEPKPKPKSKATREPSPPKLYHEPENVIVHEPPAPVLSSRQQAFKDKQDFQAKQMDLLRQALGRN